MCYSHNVQHLPYASVGFHFTMASPCFLILHFPDEVPLLLHAWFTKLLRRPATGHHGCISNELSMLISSHNTNRGFREYAFLKIVSLHLFFFILSFDLKVDVYVIPTKQSISI